MDVDESGDQQQYDSDIIASSMGKEINEKVSDYYIANLKI